jgi:hypothetical protein
MAKIYIDLRELPDLFKYNEHFAITITDENDLEYTLPYYFNTANDLRTKKNTILVIRIFNFKPEDHVFKMGIKLFQGIFLPYME